MNKTFSTIAYVCGLIIGLVLVYNSAIAQPDTSHGFGGLFQSGFDRIFGFVIGIIMVFVFAVFLGGGILEQYYKNKKK